MVTLVPTHGDPAYRAAEPRHPRHGSGWGAYAERARSQHAWPLTEEMTDAALEVRVYPPYASLAELAARRPPPGRQSIAS